MTVFLIASPFIISAFTDDPDLLQLGIRLLYVAAAFQIADGVNIVCRSVLRGTGDVRFCAWAGIGLSWLMTPPLTWLLGYHYGLGAFGGWLGLMFDIYLTTAVFWWRLTSNRWHSAADRTLQEVSDRPGAAEVASLDEAERDQVP